MANSPLFGNQAIRSQYINDPRRKMYEAMMQTGSSTAPVQSWGEGLARALQAGVGGYFGGQLRQENEQRQDDYSDAMMKALSGAQGVNQPMPEGVQGPPQQLTGVLGMAESAKATGNKDILPFAMQMQMQGMQEENAINRQDELYERKREDALMDAETQFDRQKDLAAFTAGLKPPKDARTPTQKNYDYAVSQGYQGSFNDYQTELKKAGSSITNVDLKGETKEAEEFGKLLVKREGDVYEAGDNAGTTLQSLGMAKSILQTAEADPTQFGVVLGTIANSLGVPLPEGFEKTVTSGQAFEMQMGNILANKLAAQKGPQTDRDADRMSKTLATLANTPAARQFGLDAASAIARRDQRKAEFYRNWRAEKGSISGAEKAWNDDIGKMPLFGTTKNNLPVFFDKFMVDAKKINPGMSEEQIKQEWVKRYAK